MMIIPLFMITTGQVAVRIVDEDGSVVTDDIGIGIPVGEFHLARIEKLKELSLEKGALFNLPCMSRDYSHIPEADDLQLSYLIDHIKKRRAASQNNKYKIELSPETRVELLNSYGDFEYIANNFREAISYYNMVLRIDPGESHALIFNGHSHRQIGDYHQALKYYSVVLDSDPDHEEVLYFSEMILKHMNNKLLRIKRNKGIHNS